MDDQLSTNLGMSRRKLLQRGAIVGVGTVWAAPTIQSFARPAFAGTPIDFHGLSYVGVVFLCNGQLYRAKFDVDDGWADVSGGGGKWGGVPQCPRPSGWDDAQGLTSNVIPDGHGTLTENVTRVNGEAFELSVTIPATCQFNGHQGVAMGAGGESTSQGFCAQGVIDGQTITFTAPPKS